MQRRARVTVATEKQSIGAADVRLVSEVYTAKQNPSYLPG